MLAFGAGCDVVTFDHEHVPGEHLAALEAADGGPARRPGAAFRPGQGARCATGSARLARSRRWAFGARGTGRVRGLAEVVASRPTAGGWPLVLKATSGGYDGKGIWICDNESSAADVIGHGIGLLAEEYVAFDRELAVLVARSPKGQGAAYPVVQTVQQDGICREVIAPAPGLAWRCARPAARAATIAAELDVTGLLAVELFAVGDELAHQRARDAGAQLRSLDHRRRRDLAVRAAPAGVLDLPLGIAWR